ncbi:MAG: hypothetical protein K6G94_07065 [Kiritimatiellae bacterium]|nr:hypothetical protein [Kiritimatiellia bacterium]
MRADDAQRQPGSFFFHLNTRGMKFDAAAVDKAHAAAVASGELKPTDIHIKMSDWRRQPSSRRRQRWVSARRTASSGRRR